MTSAQRGAIIGVLSHAKEALVAGQVIHRLDLALANIDAALSTGQRLVNEWQSETQALRRMEATLAKLQEARALAASDFRGCLKLLQEEVYQ
jgi:multidrug resistance efflux pump